MGFLLHKNYKNYCWFYYIKIVCFK